MPPVFIVVCNNTATSKLVYDYISGYVPEPLDDGTQLPAVPGALSLFCNFDEHGNPLPHPRALLIDSEQLESGEALDPGFRVTDLVLVDIQKPYTVGQVPEDFPDRLETFTARLGADPAIRGATSVLVPPLIGDRAFALVPRLEGQTQDEAMDANPMINWEVVEPSYFALVGRFRMPEEGAGDVTTEDDGASYTGVEVTLREHLGGVASWAGRFAEQCGLPPDVSRDVALAARWHDAGKVDPRFQRMLHGGSELRAAVAPEPLAPSDSHAREIARGMFGSGRR